MLEGKEERVAEAREPGFIRDKIESASFRGLKAEMNSHEASFIRVALEISNGSVTRAARLLGYKHHQSLISVINARHKSLLSARKPVRIRRKSIMRRKRKP